MKNRRGFSAVYILIILIIAGLIGFTGWYVYSSKNLAVSTYNGVANSTNAVNTSVQPSEFKYDVTVPESWKEYKNTQYGFSFKYPASQVVDTINYTAQEAKERPDKALLFVEVIKPGEPNPSHTVVISQTTLKVAVAEFKLGFQGNLYEKTLTSQNVSRNGHAGVRLSWGDSTDKTSGFSFQGKDILYGIGAKDIFKDSPELAIESQQIFNSLELF